MCVECIQYTYTNTPQSVGKGSAVVVVGLGGQGRVCLENMRREIIECLCEYKIFSITSVTEHKVGKVFLYQIST